MIEQHIISSGVRVEKSSPEKNQLLDKTCEIIVAFLNKNEAKVSEIPDIITDVHRTLTTLFANAGEHRAATGHTTGKAPAVAVTASITPDHIICLEDGKKLKTLKRYIGGRFGLTPDQYRTKWNLPADYPIVAPNYAAKRSRLAKNMGMGSRRTKRRARKS
ncbi:MAG: hypothetical protein RL274_1024 [Pseudomonadota bacterium]|jgi:predicted transcriptional regulator